MPSPSPSSTTLEQAKKNQRYRIVSFDCSDIELACVRLGLGTGARLTILESVFAGPIVVLVNGYMEVALGRDLCKGIYLTSQLESA